MTLGQLLDESAARHGPRPALSFRHRLTTYAELAATTDKLAAGLRELGLRRGDRVGVWLPNGTDFVLSYYGCAKAGLISVPINSHFKAEEVSYQLADSGARALISSSAFQPALEEVWGRPGGQLEHLIHTDTWADGVLSQGAAKLANAGPAEMSFKGQISDSEVAVCLYTSGTTGRPKGALLTHHNITWDADAATKVLRLSEQDRFLCVLPMFHSFAQTVFVVLPLLVGASVVILERFTPQAVWQALAENDITVFGGVPVMYAGLLQVPPSQRPRLRAAPLCISGAAALPPTLFAKVEQELGPLIEGDGPTECGPVTSVNPPAGPRKPGSVGLPLPGVEIRVVDEAEVPAPTGEVGEITVRGPNVMLGYHNRSEETAEAMRGGWFHTGDMGRFDEDGYLYIVGRKKEMLNVGGLKVYPREVELVLGEHPGVAEAVVVGVSDRARGEMPMAYVAPSPGAAVTEKELIAYCRQRLADFKVPRRIVFRESLPRSATGKVLREALGAGEGTSGGH
jgi:long-chain acyl-CoA synthetase